MTATSQHTVDPEQARELLAAGDARAFDIRGDEEWREGRIPACIRLDASAPEEGLSDLDEGHQAIVVCEDGRRSADVAEKLRDGDVDAVSIEGGMEAWRESKLWMQPSHDPDEDVHV
ncbi:MAG: rhodanese-like domain-containing protein [Actinomycetota bacterium]